jgi:hypothetical protein
MRNSSDCLPQKNNLKTTRSFIIAQKQENNPDNPKSENKNNEDKGKEKEQRAPKRRRTEDTEPTETPDAPPTTTTSGWGESSSDPRRRYSGWGEAPPENPLDAAYRLMTDKINAERKMDQVDPIWLENSYTDPQHNEIKFVAIWNDIDISEWDFEDICRKLKGQVQHLPDREGLSFFDETANIAILSFETEKYAELAKVIIEPKKGRLSPTSALKVGAINSTLTNKAYIPLFPGSKNDLWKAFPLAKSINLNEETHAAIISFWNPSTLSSVLANPPRLNDAPIEISESYLNHSKSKLWMGGVPTEFRNSTLSDYLKKNGYKFSGVEIIRDRAKMTSKGCATITFSNTEDRKHFLMNPLANPAGRRMPVQPVKKKKQGQKRRQDERH